MSIRQIALDTRFKRVINEGVWVAIGQTVRAIGMLAGVRMLTSYVEPGIYGKFTLLAGALALGAGVFCYPFLQAVLRYYHEAERSNNLPALSVEIKKFIIYATCALSVVILAVGSIYAIVHHPPAFFTTSILIILICVDMFSAYQVARLTAARRQARYSSWVATESCLKPCAAFLLIYFWEASVNAILIGYVIGVGSTLLLFHRPSLNGDHDHPETVTKKCLYQRHILNFVIPLFPLALLSWVSSLGNRYIVAGILNYEAVGIYAAAYGISLQPFNLAGAVVELTIRPIYFKSVTNQEQHREKMTFVLWLFIIVVICLCGFGIVLFLKDWIAELLLGQKFRQASDLMPYLAAGGAIMAINQVLEKPFYAHMKTHYVLYTQLSGAIISLVIGFFLILYSGLKGAAVAIPIYFGLQCLIAIYFNRRMIEARL